MKATVSGGNKYKSVLGKIEKEFKGRLGVFVGIPKGSPRYTYGGGEKNRGASEQKERTSGSTQPPLVVEVALWNEFGTSDGRIPERSFLRSTVKENASEYIELEKKVVKKALRGEIELKKGLGQIGAKAKGDVQKKIFNFTTPRNAPSTIKRKGFDAPLRDTSLLAQTISWEVKNV